MNWTDDAYPELDGDWTDEELMIAAGNPPLRGTGASTRKRKKAGSKYMCDTHSEQINELAKALAAAQGELEPQKRTLRQPSGKRGNSRVNTLT